MKLGCGTLLGKADILYPLPSLRGSLEMVQGKGDGVECRQLEFAESKAEDRLYHARWEMQESGWSVPSCLHFIKL